MTYRWVIRTEGDRKTWKFEVRTALLLTKETEFEVGFRIYNCNFEIAPICIDTCVRAYVGVMIAVLIHRHKFYNLKSLYYLTKHFRQTLCRLKSVVISTYLTLRKSCPLWP